jgi:predicted RNase H-like nuclease (RuvC/YqgF family)
MGSPKPWSDKPWSEMSVDEKLEALRHDMQMHQRQGAAAAKALEDVRRRVEEIERRFEESLLD